jgi:pimeloyl-CoA dehydrogenase small subunit
MDFSYSDEQQLLQDSVSKFIQQEYSFDQRKARIKAPGGFGRDTWKTIADMGLLGIPFSEAEGGFGGSGIDMMILMQQFGRGLVVEPYLATVVLGGGLIQHGGSAMQKQTLLPKIIDGSLLLAFAHSEPKARYELNNVTTTAKKDGDGYVLGGSKAVVMHGDSADTLIVSARTSGNARDAKGISLFLVDAKAVGVKVRGYPTIDGLHAAEVTLGNVRVNSDAIIGKLDDALPLIEQVTDIAAAALCAEAIGAMQALNDATLEYLKTRRQFGVPIGKFQALQHRMVDMIVNTEQAKSMAILAAVNAHSADAKARRHAVSAAKAYIGKASKFVGQQAIQLHGGMGMTEELSVSHYFKRLTMIDFCLGDTDYHAERFATAA